MGVHDLINAIRRAVDQDGPKLRATVDAWDFLMASWLSEDTKGDIVPALIQSRVNKHIFLAEFLCNSWTQYLGDCPRVMGNYIDDFRAMQTGENNLDGQYLTATELLVHCGCLHPPFEGPKSDILSARAWSHIHRAPQQQRWSDPLPTLDISGNASKRIDSIVHEAHDKQMDIDWVVAHCLYALPGGVVGFGQSIEARAFLFCLVSSAYDFGNDVFTFESPSRKGHELLSTLRTLRPDTAVPVSPERPCLLYKFLEQMSPILGSLPSPRLAPTIPPALHAPNGPRAHTQTTTNEAERLHPFWLFAIDLAPQPAGQQTRAVWEKLGPLLSPACAHYAHLNLPPSPAAASNYPIPLMIVVSDIIAGNSYFEGTASDACYPTLTDPAKVGQPTSDGPQEAASANRREIAAYIAKVIESSKSRKDKWFPVFTQTHLERILSVRFLDIDAALRSWPNSFITKAWKNALPGLLTTLARSIIYANPSTYRNCVRAAADAMVDVYRFDDVLEKLDQERLSLFWLQLVAQCGEYAEAFKGTLVEHADRKTVEKVFVVLKLLEPSADDKTKQKIASLQEVYSANAYAEPQTRPPHLVDRFVEICVELARRKTAIAQALSDSGFVALLTAIQGGTYDYPEAPDLQPLEVRAIVRRQMCGEALAVLAERL